MNGCILLLLLWMMAGSSAEEPSQASEPKISQLDIQMNVHLSDLSLSSFRSIAAIQQSIQSKDRDLNNCIQNEYRITQKYPSWVQISYQLSEGTITEPQIELKPMNEPIQNCFRRAINQWSFSEAIDANIAIELIIAEKKEPSSQE